MLVDEQSFAKSQRLLKPAEFRNVFANGKRLRSHAFVVIAARNTLEYPRIGLAISKKNIPRAVDRNRLKRLIRENFRTNKSRLGNYDIVIQATTAARALTNECLKKKLETVWERLQ